jgi:hypothetical protein
MTISSELSIVRQCSNPPVGKMSILCTCVIHTVQSETKREYTWHVQYIYICCFNWDIYIYLYIFVYIYIYLYDMWCRMLVYISLYPFIHYYTIYLCMYVIRTCTCTFMNNNWSWIEKVTTITSLKEWRYPQNCLLSDNVQIRQEVRCQ